MLQTSKLMPQGAGLAPVLVKRATTVELDWDQRQKSNFDATDSSGRALSVSLPHGTLVRGGDVLIAEDGSLIRIVAAPQHVLVITTCSQHGSAFDLTRAAYRLGQRQVPVELKPDHLKIEPDPALADMLRAMHLTVSEALNTFEPEAAIDTVGAHRHGSPAHIHRHGLKPELGPESALASTMKSDKSIIPISAAKPHVHGPGCGHNH